MRCASQITIFPALKAMDSKLPVFKSKQTTRCPYTNYKRVCTRSLIPLWLPGTLLSVQKSGKNRRFKRHLISAEKIKGGGMRPADRKERSGGSRQTQPGLLLLFFMLHASPTVSPRLFSVFCCLKNALYGHAPPSERPNMYARVRSRRCSLLKAITGFNSSFNCKVSLKGKASHDVLAHCST